MAGRVHLVAPDLVARLTLLATTVLGVAAFGWPFLWQSSVQGGDASHTTDAPWLFAGLLGLLGAVVAAEISRNRLAAKAVAVLGVLASIGGALRVLSPGSTSLELMFFLLVLAGRVLGPGGGFLLGNLSMIVGATLTGGVGPWLPFQMLAGGWVAMGAGMLPALRGRPERLLLAAYGLVTGLLYGAVMNLWFWPFMTAAGSGIGYVPGAGVATNLAHYGAFYVATSLAWDLPRGILCAALCLLTGRRVLSALRRGIAPALWLPAADGRTMQTNDADGQRMHTTPVGWLHE